MDPFVKAYIKVHVHVDAGGRVFCKGQEIPVHNVQNVKKVVLPISKILYTFDDLRKAGAKVDVSTLFSLARAGAEGRWRDEIAARKESGLPSNVYIANARSIEYALSKDKTPPPVKYVGRKRDKITEVFDTVDEVVDALDKEAWRTTFSRGRHARKHPK